MDDLDDARAKEAAAASQLDRAERARVLLEDPLFSQAVKAVKNAAWGSFRAIDPRDARGLLAARLKMDAIDEIEGELRTHVQTGVIARHQLGLIREFIDRLTRRRAG